MNRSRLLIVAVPALVGLMTPGVAAANRTTGTATVTLTVNAATCEFTVSASWSGFGTGPGYVDLSIDEQGAPDMIYRHRFSPVSLASDSRLYTFHLTPAAETHSWVGQEMLSRTNGKSTPYGVCSQFTAVQQVTGCADF